MKKNLYALKSNEELHPCVLCDNKTASFIYMGKPVCEQCIKFVKSEF